MQAYILGASESCVVKLVMSRPPSLILFTEDDCGE